MIFTSDNGGTPRGVNRPLRGHKASTWEGGVRVCTIAWWPGKIPANTATDAIAGMFDILPTFAALAGGALPTDRKIDGANLWPILADEPNAKPPHDTFYYYRGLRLEAVRHGDWKLQLAGFSPAWPGTATNPAAQRLPANAPTTKAKLFNLKTDLSETTDVADANPAVVAQLEALVAAMKDDLGLDGPAPGSRALGRVENPQPLISPDGKIRAGLEPAEK